MKPNIAREIERLSNMTVAELREKYAEVFGEETRSRHKDFLRKRIAWRLQANEEGGLSERALRRARELANEADLRLIAPRGRTEIHRFRPSHDRRLPMPGTVITREYKGRTISVMVLDEGFEFEGEVYRSLSAVARKITGTQWNGYLFFDLAKRGNGK
ncbi:MAG: DUF2924 domain-containing protein [Candidatus Eisenbacteria bacterium]|uniref:DUF2924 domain-containing protein n=1 Tax=Eiseniibacteriota bacterium TaxID=2212470 RepID=A0A948RWN2_UNCEI|nr:DUF2924 domain-containing protein [Candidatus Eisenbacteria bacterium]MBU1950044.1 DUF2924 domain-containing protein [Candidatus Eisenbacteria bacterium]MBU2692405.1 DUF2924 domain-containing protein [Candidatus Eisenbacteria bacterium]